MYLFIVVPAVHVQAVNLPSEMEKTGSTVRKGSTGGDGTPERERQDH